MAIKFNSRRKASKSAKQDVSAQYSQRLSGKQGVSNVSNTNRKAEPVSLYKEQRAETNSDEARDVHPMARLFDDASSVISGAMSEAASMANDVKMIIAADVDDDVSALGEERSVAPQPEPEQIKDMGGPKDLARLIKDLGQQEKKMEKLGQEYINAEKDVRNTRKRIKALSEKLNLDSAINENEQEDDEGSLGESSIVETLSAYGSLIENAATKAIFPRSK
eukprot:CAMPEP_0113416480 /NCGR_PEP_ID=MMETSP0013_2-20120614/25137_1 /TAXON_ID=2843 ORGANISM="Skeletonema costatum, Strain 1716" /NCGR_SAMPLE_ID=MMETSP0013_2 /ASSEMBLY_ACC=CAM_ASM_000158 /LENGTH=220 /DNA_ID=CAMNT_0000303535 /DNA_START=13 /DNA_END=676 /DNA_ORIENTATION=+ /assembly_acc=CAM_ASM_000158